MEGNANHHPVARPRKIGILNIGVLVALGVLLVGLAACGSDEGGDGTSSAGGSALSGTVTVWDTEYQSFPAHTKAVDQIDAEFEKLHPGVEVVREAQAPASVESLYRAAFVSQEGPDLMVFQPGAAGVLSYAKGLELLNPYISDELQEQLTQWPTVTSDYAVDGEHFGVPIGVNGVAFYYNKELFEKAGLPTDFAPETWAEVREAGEKLEAAGIQPFTGGNKGGEENSLWFSAGFETESTPEQARELADGTMPLTDEAIAKAFGPQFEMQEAGLYPPDRFTTEWFPDGFVPFQEGKGAMTIGLWSVAGYWGEFNAALGEENVGIFLAPGADSVATTANLAYGIPKFSENKDAAWALVEYTASKRGNEVLSRVGGYMPARKDVELPPSAPVQERQLQEALLNRDETVLPYVMLPGTVAFGPMSTEINQALQGRTSLQSAQEAMQQTAEAAGG